MRLAFALCFVGLGSAAQAWEFAPLPLCTLTHQTDGGTVMLTYDPAKPEYTVSLVLDTGSAVWPEGIPFGMTFLGDQDVRIGTDRHVISDGGRKLTVTDSGFGNVLDGLEFNALGAGHSGNVSLQFSLTGAAMPVAAFRACGSAALS